MPDDVAPPRAHAAPLPWWAHAWRLVLMVSLSAAAWYPLVGEVPWEFVLFDALLGLTAYALVLFRRRHPVAVAVATATLAAFSPTALGPTTLALASLATGRRTGPVVAVALLNVAVAEVFEAVHPAIRFDPAWLGLTLNGTFVAACVGWGMYIGSRRELLRTLHRRADAAEAERDLRAQQARLEERGRIAREMHDVLAHRISRISLQAGALSYRSDPTWEELREGLGVIREASHQALTDLRGVLGVLRDADADADPRAPQPTVADLEHLVRDSRESGMEIRYEQSIAESGSMPDSTGRTLYRIVQEGITNAAKHARDAHVDIRLSGSAADGITFAVRNPLGFGPAALPSSGFGLIGLTERVRLHGGRLEHERTGDDFVLSGWVPWAP